MKMSGMPIFLRFSGFSVDKYYSRKQFGKSLNKPPAAVNIYGIYLITQVYPIFLLLQSSSPDDDLYYRDKI